MVNIFWDLWHVTVTCVVCKLHTFSSIVNKILYQIFMSNIMELIIPCWNVYLKNSTVWLKLQAQLIAVNYISTLESTSNSTHVSIAEVLVLGQWTFQEKWSDLRSKKDRLKWKNYARFSYQRVTILIHSCHMSFVCMALTFSPSSSSG